jgi:hypothetical protein
MLQSPPLSTVHTSPHRLGAQDEALSRLKLEFESPWGHWCKALQTQGFSFE